MTTIYERIVNSPPGKLISKAAKGIGAIIGNNNEESKPSGDSSQNSDDDTTTSEESGDNDDDVKAVESCDEYTDDFRSSTSSRKDQYSNISSRKHGPTSRIVEVSDDQLGNFATDELSLNKVRRQDGTPCWKKKREIICDQKDLRQYCMNEHGEKLSEYVEAVNQAGVDRFIAPPTATVKKRKCSSPVVTPTHKSAARELQTTAKRKRTVKTSKKSAWNALKDRFKARNALKEKGWRCAAYRGLGCKHPWIYISPDFTQTGLGKVECKVSKAPGKLYQDYFFAPRDAEKVLDLVLKKQSTQNQKLTCGRKGKQDGNKSLRRSPRLSLKRTQKGNVMRKAREKEQKRDVGPCLSEKVKSSSSPDKVRQPTTTLSTEVVVSSIAMDDEYIIVKNQNGSSSSSDSKSPPPMEEPDNREQGSPDFPPLIHALLDSNKTDDEDSWMADIAGLCSLDPDAMDFVYEHNEYVWQHKQFYSMSLRSEEVVVEEEEEEEEESYGEGDDASHVETTGRKRSLKERRSRNTVSDYSWAEVWDYLCKKHQWSWIQSPSDLILKGSWVYLRAGVIKQGRGNPSIFTADTLEPAKEGLHFFMNPQGVMEYIEERAHPDIKFGLHDYKDGKVVYSGSCLPWVNEQPHGSGRPALHYYEGDLCKFLKDKGYLLGMRRNYHEYLLQDNLNRSWGAIASGADHFFTRRHNVDSRMKSGLTRRDGSAPKQRPRRRNKYASVTSVNETTAIEVVSKQPLSREEKRAATKKEHEEEYPPPMDVSSNRAFELISSLPQANEDYVSLLHMKHATKFPLWRSILKFGWSLGLYGVGSKAQLLDDFVRRELSQETNGTKILTVRAFMGSKISLILTNLCRCAMGQATADITFRFDPIEHADTILAAYDTSLKRQGLNPQCDDDKIIGLPIHKGMARYNFFEDTGKDGGRINEILATVKGEGEQEIRTTRARECALRSGFQTTVPPHIFLAIHNIDAEQLRDRKSQEALGMVAKHARIHLIATVDHVNAALLWDDELCGQEFFHWQWEYAPTCRRFDKELLYVTGTDVLSKARMAHGLNFVLESLTNKHLIIAKTLARTILKMGPEVQQVDRGMGMQELFSICRNELFLQRAQNLTPYIKVLEDNNIVNLGSHPTYGPQWLTMPQHREVLLCIDKFGQVGG